MLQFPNSLREQVAERDLVGDDIGVELSPEQAANITKFKAAIDEHMGYYDEKGSQDQEVQVLFVAAIKPEARAAALKAAFEKAREECELLATASGHKLGRLISLSKASADESSSSTGFSMGLGSDASDALVARMAKATRRDEPPPDKPTACKPASRCAHCLKWSKVQASRRAALFNPPAQPRQSQLTSFTSHKSQHQNGSPS